MKLLQPWLGRQVEAELSGRRMPIRGKLIDMGNDIIVVHNGTQFLYIPAIHLQSIKLAEATDDVTYGQTELLFDHTDISYRKVVMNAKGMFTEITINGVHSLHGYITSIMNDFFVFFSPVYRTVYVSMGHVKTITPYESNVTPYELSHERFPLQPAGITLSRTFDQQLKKLEGELVVLDLAKIGRLHAIENGLLELVSANGQRSFTHIDHVKTIHTP